MRAVIALVMAVCAGSAMYIVNAVVLTPEPRMVETWQLVHWAVGWVAAFVGWVVAFHLSPRVSGSERGHLPSDGNRHELD